MRYESVALLVALSLSLLLSDDATAQKKPPPKKLPSQQFKGYGLPEPVKSPPKQSMQVARVDADRRAEAVATAAKIDAFIEANLAKQGLKPNPDADAYTFVRRAHLDITGTIPTLVATSEYATNKAKDRREALIDSLLSSPGYVSHLYSYWASVLRIKDRPENNMLAFAYRDWVKEQLRINRPYDKWVFEMLTAEGKLWENPAVGYTLRDHGMPLVHVDNTVRVFLGTQIGCAQCHDHPFDKWKQKDFYQLAAFTHGVGTRDAAGSPAFANGNPIARVRDEFKKQEGSGVLKGSPQLLLNANLYRVSFNAARKLKLPHDYQYDNGKPNQVVTPGVLWGKLPDGAKKLPLREQFATWLTSSSNPRFAKTLANRLWKRVMGVGLIEPVDDLREDSPCENAELLEFLTKELIRLDFNQKEFLRTLLYTKTYQRDSGDYDPSKADFYHYPGPTLRRMTAEQVWDSILTLAIYNPYPFELPSTKTFREIANLDLAKVNLQELKQTAARFDETVSPVARNKLMNMAAYRKQILARASELPSPLPAEHFIRQFGQCDRETIQGDSTDPTVPQLLTMFNGPFTHMMLEKGSVIYDSILGCATPRQAMDVMFLTILNRPPTSNDREVTMREISRGDKLMGYGNVVWALINTREFLFIQ
jgi:Protein of unknown function (DUF1549)/Protein of unknown function (DUF1553)